MILAHSKNDRFPFNRFRIILELISFPILIGQVKQGSTIKCVDDSLETKKKYVHKTSILMFSNVQTTQNKLENVRVLILTKYDCYGLFAANFSRQENQATTTTINFN